MVSMTTGLASTIQEFALYCFSQKAFFADVGDAGAETAPPATTDHIPGLWLLMRTLEGMRAVPADAPRMVPVDPERHVMALYLSLLMMRFVWFHELAHGLLGHVDYRRQVLGDGACRVEELISTETAAPSGSLDSQSLQCMEFEADSWALSRCLLIQQGGLENIDGIAALPEALRLRLTLFGIYAMTALFEVFQTVLYRRKLSVTHPAPLTRLKMLASRAGWDAGTMEGPGVSMAAKAALDQLRMILAPVGSSWQTVDGFDPDRYKARFDALRETLAPFRYMASA